MADRARGHRVEAAGLAISGGPDSRLVQVQEPDGSCREAGG